MRLNRAANENNWFFYSVGIYFQSYNSFHLVFCKIKQFRIEFSVIDQILLSDIFPAQICRRSLLGPAETRK